jgi:hypothetical protein
VSSSEQQGFIQEYVPGLKQELFIYCRLCRRIFPVMFKPRPQVRLRCTCGHEAPLVELDVCKSEKSAKAHAAFYEKIYQAAKSALRDAGIPLPPSGKFRMADYMEPDGLPSSGPREDESDARNGLLPLLQDEDDEQPSPERVSARLASFDEQVKGCADPFAKHDALSATIEWTYVRRHHDPRARERFIDACHQDMDLAPALVAAAREKLKGGGERVRLAFTSFKHLALVLEDDGLDAQALEVYERAMKLGLKGYDEKAAELRARLGKA